MDNPISAPALPSTADTTPYVPVSWMAVAALVVAVLFVLVLFVLGAFAFKEKKPLLMLELLLFPVVGVVLSFAARRMIRNSEGTRTGEKLVNAAWWTSIVAGLGFAAYLFAIDFSIRRDAKHEVELWVGYVMKDDPTDLNRAFLRTLEPGRRGQIRPDNTAQLQAEFRDPYLAFGQCDVVRMVQRNKGACTFEARGVKDWAYRPTGVECIFTGELKSPEGTFPILVPLRGVESGAGEQSAGRQWVIAVPQGGLFVRDQVKLTPYGWLVFIMEQSGTQFGKEFITAAGNGPTIYPLLYHDKIGPEDKRQLWDALGATTPARWVIGGVPAGFAGLPQQLMTVTILRWGAGGGPAGFAPYHTADSVAYYRDRFFKLHGGKEPDPDQQKRFKIAWETLGILPSGTRLKNSPDTNEVITVTDTAVEVRIPCELPIPGSELTAARCRLLVTCTDPALLAEVKRLREEAKPSQVTSAPTEDPRKRVFKWRVVRVETDLYPIQVMSQRQAAMAGMPGGGGPGGPGGPPPGPGGQP